MAIGSPHLNPVKLGNLSSCIHGRRDNGFGVLLAEPGLDRQSRSGTGGGTSTKNWG